MTSSGVRTERLTFAQAAAIALVVSVVDFPALPCMLDQKSRATPVIGRHCEWHMLAPSDAGRAALTSRRASFCR